MLNEEMKKFIIGGLISISSLYGGVWTSVSGFGTKEINPDFTYTLDTIGQNPRVYEFDTQGYPKMHCVVIFRDDTKTSPAIHCVETKPEYIKMNEKLK